MLIRRSSKGEKVYIFKPRTKENISYKISNDEIVSFDAQNKSYIVINNGAVVKRTNSWKTAEDQYLKECKKYYSDTNGRVKLGESTLENAVFKAL